MSDSAEFPTVSRPPQGELPPPLPFIRTWSERREWLTAAIVTLVVSALTVIGGPGLYESRVPVLPFGMMLVAIMCGFLPSFTYGAVSVVVLSVVLGRGDPGRPVMTVATLRFAVSVGSFMLLSVIGELLKRNRVRSFNRLRALRESEARYRSILEDANEGIVLLDPSRERVVVANARAAETLGVTREQLLGISVRDMVLRQNPPRVMDWLYAGWGPEIVEAEHRYTRPDGEIRVLHLSARRLGSGAVQAIIRDVTEHLVQERAMHESRRLEAVGRLASGVAHDFNNILQAVSISAEELQSAFDPADPRRVDADTIFEASQRAASLVSGLLAFSRRQEGEPSALSVDEHIAGFEAMLRTLVGTGVTVELSLDATGAAVLIDGSQFEQVLMNLAVNARDAMPRGGTLRISTTRVPPSGAMKPGAVRLRVSDTGEGIPAAIRSQIFDPYFTTKGEGKGTGLGLATVYAIVKRAGGSIEVGDAAGGGAAFTLVIPLVPVRDELRSSAPATAA